MLRDGIGFPAIDTAGDRGGSGMADDRGAGDCDPAGADRAQASGGDARNGDSIARMERGGAAAGAGAAAAEAEA